MPRARSSTRTKTPSGDRSRPCSGGPRVGESAATKVSGPCGCTARGAMVWCAPQSKTPVYPGRNSVTMRLTKALLWAGTMLAMALPFAGTSNAQSGEPIKIGFSMALTGPLSPNGKQALLGLQIWEEEVNAKGGLLGRPVKLVYYDDQSQSAPVPGIYTKLLDVDKVDLVLGPYATVPAAAAMPVIMQKNKMMIILFGLA